MNYVILEGSERTPVPVVSQGAVPSGTLLRVAVELRRKAAPADHPALPISRETHRELFGTDPNDALTVIAMAKSQGITVVETCLRKRLIILEGTLEAIQKLFCSDVQLAIAANPPSQDSGQGLFRYRIAPIKVPEAMSGIVLSVFGIDNRSQVSPHLAISPTELPVLVLPNKIGQLYSFPNSSGAGYGEGAIIAFLEFGGGYDFADLEMSRQLQGLPPGVPPTCVELGSAQNRPGTTPGHHEVALDLQIAASIAPAASLIVYLTGRSDFDIFCALSAAIHAEKTPTAISMSWGAPETLWTNQAHNAFDRYLEDAGRLGIAFFASSGDRGSGRDAKVTEFPASSPRVVACGGTQFVSTGPPGYEVEREVVWSEPRHGEGSGGGFSSIYGASPCQTGAVEGIKFRGVPDVAGYASNNPGYLTILNGIAIPQGGTSAVAPLYAGLYASLAGSDLLVDLNALTYSLGPEAFEDIVDGDNILGSSFGGYQAGKGWDPCTGLGRIKGDVFAEALKPKLKHRPP